MRPRHTQPPDDLTTMYEHYLPLLARLATRHGVSSQDAQTLAQNVLLASLFHVPRITNLRLWLAAATTAAAERYRKAANA